MASRIKGITVEIGIRYNKHRRSGNPCIFRGSRLFCYYRVISSVFNGL